MLVVEGRGHHPADEDTGSYLLFKPATMTTSNSDYMAMPGVLKAGTVEAVGPASDLDRSSKPSLPSQAAALSSSAGLYDSDYMEMAARAVHASKAVSEPGHRKPSEVPVKKLSTGSRGGDESGNKNVPEVSSKKLSLGSRIGDDYMRMQAPNEESYLGYMDMKNVAHRSTGWL